LRRQHYESYLPLVRLHRRRRGGWEEVTEPLFPGYLFVRLDTRRDNTAPIRSTRGVIGLVRFGGTLRPVPEGLVERLLAAPAGPGGAIRQEHFFQAGERVEIVEGPLAGLQAIFLAPTGQQRAQLLLELLGRETRVVVPQDRLAPSG
jgi:transcriptional antiterminator RfaH